MLTSNSFRKDFRMMVLKQRFLNDDTKSLKKFHQNGIKKFKKVADGTKKVP